jgi:hypothetical protein
MLVSQKRLNFQRMNKRLCVFRNAKFQSPWMLPFWLFFFVNCSDACCILIAVQYGRPTKTNNNYWCEFGAPLICSYFIVCCGFRVEVTVLWRAPINLLCPSRIDPLFALLQFCFVRCFQRPKTC